MSTIAYGHPDTMPENTDCVVSLDRNVKPKGMKNQTRIVRHIPNPYRGKGKPIDMSVVNMSDVWKTADMIVTLYESDKRVFVHCRFGKDRTGLVMRCVKNMIAKRGNKNE